MAWGDTLFKYCSLYGKGSLELPMTSLVEELKCAKISLEMTLTLSKDPAVKNTTPTVNTGRKWNPREAVQHAQGALQHRDIIGQIQSGIAGFGISLGRYRVEEQGLG